ncbi:hypothetical protein [Hymenobacter tenuis]
MIFEFNAYSALLLPFCVHGLVFTALLLMRSWRLSEVSDRWLALLVLLCTLKVAHWMLGFAGWYSTHDGHSMFMFYFPFELQIGLGPLFYIYFRSMTNQDYRVRGRRWGHFAPLLAYVAWHLVCFGADVGLRHWLRGHPLPGHFGTQGPLISLAWPHQAARALGYLLLFGYGYATLQAFRQYHHYLNSHFSSTEWVRFNWLRNALRALLLAVVVSLLFSALDWLVGPLSYAQYWYEYLATGLLLVHLSVAGWQIYHPGRARLYYQPSAHLHL